MSRCETTKVVCCIMRNNESLFRIALFGTTKDFIFCNIQVTANIIYKILPVTFSHNTINVRLMESSTLILK